LLPVVLPLLLVSLPLFHPCQGPYPTSVVAIIVLSLAIKDASLTMAKMPVQQGHWHRCNNGKNTSNRGNTTIKDASAMTAMTPVQGIGATTASLIVMLPLLLASLPLLNPCQHPHCTGVIAIVALAFLIANKSTSMAMIPMQ
jgi:hypothetical protein